MNLYGCYRELCPSSGVTCATLFEAQDKSQLANSIPYIFLASNSTIRIFSISSKENGEGSPKLRSIYTTSLYGKVRDVTSTSYKDIHGNIDHQIFVSLDNCKVAIVRYNAALHKLEHLKFLNAEENAIGLGSEEYLSSAGLTRKSLTTQFCPYIVVDKNSTVSCVLVYGQDVLAIPIHRGLLNVYGKGKPKPFFLSLSNLGVQGIVRDITFLDGDHSPMLAVLHESRPLPLGHLCKIRNPCCLSVVAVDVTNGTSAVLWTQDHLPHDSHRIIASRVAGAVFVISTNAILFVQQGGVQGLSVNGLSHSVLSPDVDYKLQPWPLKIGEELDASHWIDVKGCGLTGVLKTGALLVCRYRICNPLSARPQLIFEPHISGSTVPPSCLLVTPWGTSPGNRQVGGENEMLWFIGSRVADSLLFSVTLRYLGVEVVNTEPEDTGTSAFTSPLAKRSRRSSRGSINSSLTPTHLDVSSADYFSALVEHASDIATEEEQLYQTTVPPLPPAQPPASIPWASPDIVVIDRLYTMGPIRDGLFSHSDDWLGTSRGVVVRELGDQKLRTMGGSSLSTFAAPAAAYIAERDAKDNLYLCHGRDGRGGVSRATQGYGLLKIASRDFSGLTAISSVVIAGGRREGFRGTPSGNAVSLVFLSQHSRTRLLQARRPVSSGTGLGGLVISELEVVSSGFVDTTTTVHAGSIEFPGDCFSYIVQVIGAGVRLLQVSMDPESELLSMEALQDAMVEEGRDLGGLEGAEGESVVSSDIEGDYVLLQTNYGSLFILKMDDTRELRLENELRSPEYETSESKADPIGTVLRDHIGVSGVMAASLYKGAIGPMVNAATPSQGTQKRKFDEDEYLYGVSTGAGVTPGVVEEDGEGSNRAEEGEEAQIANGITTNDESSLQNGEEMHLVIITEFGVFVVIGLVSKHVKLVVTDLPALPQFITTEYHSEGQVDGSRSDHRSPPLINPQRFKEVKLVEFQSHSVGLVLITEVDDVVIYVSHILSREKNGYILSSFRKLDHGMVTRAKRGASGRTYSMDASTKAWSESSGREKLLRVNGSGDDISVSVSGPRPMILTCNQGALTLLPLSFPELPYANEKGSFSLAPLYCGTGVSGFCSLWREAGDALKGVRIGSLGFYRGVEGLQVVPGGGVTLWEARVGSTVHKCVELQAKVDDRTQQALLKRRTFVLVCSDLVPEQFVPEVMSEKEKEIDSENYDRFFPNLDSYSTPQSQGGPPPVLWSRRYKICVVQNTEIVDVFQMKKDEVVVDIDAAYMLTEYEATPAASGTHEGKDNRVKRKAFIVVGTSQVDMHGEDTQGEGRLLLLGLDYAIYQQVDATRNEPEPDARHTENIEGVVNTDSSSALGLSSDSEGVFPNESKSEDNKANSGIASRLSTQSQSLADSQFLDSITPKLKLCWAGFGPATVVRQFGEFVLSTVGQTVYIYRYSPEAGELEQIAQFYAQFYIAAVSIIKNYIVLADAFKSIQFIVWREDDWSLTLVAKDYWRESCTMTADFIVDGSTLGIVACDDDGNMRLLRYNSSVLESKKGFQLMCVADSHIGSEVSVLVPHRMLADSNLQSQPPGYRPNRVLSYGARFNKTSSSKSALVMCNLDGGIGLMIPMDERTYRRLALLQQIMSTSIETTCGLNPRDFRLIKSNKFLREKKRGVLDGTLLFRFVTLEPAMQLEFTAAMGTTVELVLDNLLEIDIQTSFF